MADTLYKVLHTDGRAFHGGSGTWHLPHGKRPGKWMPVLHLQPFHGTRQTPLMRRIEAFAPSPEPPLASRCVVRGSSFYSVAEHGGETGPPPPGYAVPSD